MCTRSDMCRLFIMQSCHRRVVLNIFDVLNNSLISVPINTELIGHLKDEPLADSTF